MTKLDFRILKPETRAFEVVNLFGVCLFAVILMTATGLARELILQSQPGREKLLTQLTSGNEDQRLEAIIELGNLLAGSSDSAVKPILAPVINVLQRDPSPVVRALAARALELARDEESVPALLTSLNLEREVAVRKAIIYALARHRSSQIANNLTPLLKDKNPEIRAAAAYALAEISEPSSADALTELLRKRNKDEDAFARSQAARALGRFGGQSSIDTLIHLLAHDKSEEVRREAAQALGDVASKQDERVLEALRDAVRQNDPYLTAVAEAAIAKINSSNR